MSEQPKAIPSGAEGDDAPAAGRGVLWKVVLPVGLAVAVVAVLAFTSRRHVPGNPLDGALATGRPVVADFGRDKCIPCQMMKSVLDGIARDYAGRVEVVLVNIDESPDVAERVGISFIPAQVFYDAGGAEVGRHQGFMPREDIVAKLTEMGVK